MGHVLGYALTGTDPLDIEVAAANVTGTDRNGRGASGTDDLPTVLQAVLPQPEIVNGTARLRGASGWVRGPFTARATGSRSASTRGAARSASTA